MPARGEQLGDAFLSVTKALSWRDQALRGFYGSATWGNEQRYKRSNGAAVNIGDGED